MLNRSGDSPHPCLTPLLVLIGSEICLSLCFMGVFALCYRLCIAFKSFVADINLLFQT
jgi:hypothetical protein